MVLSLPARVLEKQKRICENNTASAHDDGDFKNYARVKRLYKYCKVFVLFLRYGYSLLKTEENSSCFQYF